MHLKLGEMQRLNGRLRAPRPARVPSVRSERPRLYFRALVMLAQVQDRRSSKLSDLDKQRIRAEALLRLEKL